MRHKRNWPLMALPFLLPLSSVSAQKALPDGWVEYDKPHLIPDYFGWSKFFERADTSYRLGEGYFASFLDSSIGIYGHYEDRPELGRRVFLLISNQSALARQFVERCRNEIASSQRLTKQGDRAPEEHEAREVVLLKEEVKTIRDARNALREAIMDADRTTGSKVWRRIANYAMECKQSINIRRERTPHDDRVWQIFLSFDKTGEEK